MTGILLAPLVAACVLALVAAALALQRSSQRRLVGRVGVPSPAGVPRVLAFTGESCTLCHVAQRPALERLRADAGDLEVTEIDIARDPQTTRRYRVMTLPTTVVLDPRGRISAVNAGFASEALLRTQVAAARGGTAVVPA